MTTEIKRDLYLNRLIESRIINKVEVDFSVKRAKKWRYS